MNWIQFKQRYHRELSHIAGYEEKFVELVLSQIPELIPTDVIPQYHFKDTKGGSRYVDFMIINQSKNWLLPIELDGYAKMVGNGEEYYRFNDFLERQNAMMYQFGVVLRYANKKMLTEPCTIIREIEQMLQRQSQDKSLKNGQNYRTKAIVAKYETKIKQLKAKQRKQFLGFMVTIVILGIAVVLTVNQPLEHCPPITAMHPSSNKTDTVKNM